MPTKGIISKQVNQVNIFPLTFGELLKYLGDEQLTTFREYIRAFQFMIKADPGIGELSILDMDYLLYIFKAVSSSKDSRLTITTKCSHCGERHSISLKLNQIEFYDIDEKYLTIDSINLDSTEIKIKYITINEFIYLSGKLDRKMEGLNIDLIKLACMLDLDIIAAINLLSKCQTEDIALINHLDNKLFKVIKPVEIKCPNNPNLRGTTATYTMSAVDIFRDIIRLNPIAENQISFREVSKTSKY